MNELIFFEKIIKERIWGLEYWLVSAHENGDTVIKNGEYKGKTLSWLWNNKRDLFGKFDSDDFPLLVKTIDAKDDLSVQVHPNDGYAELHENGSKGKNETRYAWFQRGRRCWPAHLPPVPFCELLHDHEYFRCGTCV